MSEKRITEQQFDYLLNESKNPCCDFLAQLEDCHCEEYFTMATPKEAWNKMVARIKELEEKIKKVKGIVSGQFTPDKFALVGKILEDGKFEQQEADNGNKT